MTITLLFASGALWLICAAVFYGSALTRIGNGQSARGGLILAAVAAIGGIVFIFAAMMTAAR